MTDMYLLFEWTEEREAKMHLGIYTSVEKAKAAADHLWKHELINDRGAEPHEVPSPSLRWEENSRSEDWTGFKDIELTDPDILSAYDAEVPYEIEKFEADTVVVWSRVKNEETGRYENVQEKFAL